MEHQKIKQQQQQKNGERDILGNLIFLFTKCMPSQSPYENVI